LLQESSNVPNQSKTGSRWVKSENPMQPTHRPVNSLDEHQAARELSQLTANVPAVLFRCDYDRGRNLHFISAAIEALSGWSPTDFDTGRVAYTNLMLPTDEAQIWRAVGDSLADGTPYTVEYRLLHRDGSSIWVSETGRVALDEHGLPVSIVGTITDNTRIKSTSAEFEGTVNALDRATAVAEFDLRGCVLRANDNFLKLMGYTAAEIVGHHHRIFCTREQSSAPEYVEFWDRLRRGEVDTGEYLRIGKGGREVWIQATYNPIFDADGQPYKVMKFATDLSQRRAMEKDLRVAIERAEEAVEARGNFLANMSHEIRTPMNAIIGFSEAVLDSDLDEDQHHKMNIVLTASRSLLRLLNEVLDMAKLDKGAVEIEIRDFNLFDLCEQLLASLRIQADSKGLNLRLDVSPEVPEYVRGDSLRIQQILLNLLSNAVKFTLEGEVRLDLRYTAGVLEADVIDTGVGMPAEYLDHIFEPFTQSDASTTRTFGGTGLGTSIAHQMTELLGGTLAVESTEGVGTTFHVRVPLPRGSVVETTAAEVPDLAPLSILAVDDTPPSLELLKITLERYGHRVTTAASGGAAVAASRANRFDVILTDLQMPEMDGFETARAIRADEQAAGLAEVPIIALSAHVMAEHRELALAAGMNGFAHKPLDAPALFGEIARVTAEEAAPTTLAAEPIAETVIQPASARRAPSAGPTKSTAVNWRSGLSLWGDRDVLTRHITQFVEEHAHLAENLESLYASGGAAAIIPLTHRVRGVSGNLSLPRIHRLTTDLEIAAHKGQTERIEELLAELPVAISGLAAAVAVLTPAPPPPVPVAESATPILKDECVDHLTRALQELAERLNHNELCPDALNVLSGALPADDVRPLISALDRFDFPRASAAVNTLRTKYCAEAGR
jgi:PAS domain S-box-containing protein